MEDKIRIYIVIHYDWSSHKIALVTLDKEKAIMLKEKGDDFTPYSMIEVWEDDKHVGNIN